MQRVVLVRYTVKPDLVAQNERLSRAVFDELRSTAPDVSYAVFKNGAEFVHLFVNLSADDSTAVTELPSFKAYVKDIAARCVAPPEQTRLSVEFVDGYGLPGIPARKTKAA